MYDVQPPTKCPSSSSKRLDNIGSTASSVVLAHNRWLSSARFTKDLPGVESVVQQVETEVPSVTNEPAERGTQDAPEVQSDGHSVSDELVQQKRI